MQVVVYGAGAIGSVLGGMLAIHHHEVLLVGREALGEAVRREGLRLKSGTGERVAHPRVATALTPSDINAGTHIFLTVKSYDVAAALSELGAVVPVDIPIICFQNGVASEPLAAEKFSNVYGGVCRMTCSMIHAGNASFQSLGRLVVGLHPRGSNATSRGIALAFRAAGFDAASSRTIESDKWLKLALNTGTIVHAAVDPRDHESNEFHELKALLLEEVQRVYRAGKIRARSCDGRDPSIAEMIAELRRPVARRTGHGVKPRNSLWQDLYLKRDQIESEYIHGPIIAMGRDHGVPTPYNRAMLGIARRLHETGTGPETLRLMELYDAVEKARKAS
ncbi:MAG TPA: 2-dehydropantoate 2-reductase [Candidatus Krumholzibacteria bacterium]|nr:2-dehydropantoate 2-reductase [Candidatus Krumholzibacteria bacterium]